MLSAMLMNGPHSPPASVNNSPRYVSHPSQPARGAAGHGQGQLAQVDTHILSVGKIYFCRDYLVSEGIIDAGGYKRVGLPDDTQP